MDPVYVTQTTIAVTILHKKHYSIEVLKTKTKRIIGFQNIIGFFIITLRVLLLLLLLCATGSDIITGSDVSHVIFPRFFLTIVVVQNISLLFIIRFTFLIIPLVSFGHFVVCHSIYVSDYSFSIL